MTATLPNVSPDVPRGALATRLVSGSDRMALREAQQAAMQELLGQIPQTLGVYPDLLHVVSREQGAALAATVTVEHDPLACAQVVAEHLSVTVREDRVHFTDSFSLRSTVPGLDARPGGEAHALAEALLAELDTYLALPWEILQDARGYVCTVGAHVGYGAAPDVAALHALAYVVRYHQGAQPPQAPQGPDDVLELTALRLNDSRPYVAPRVDVLAELGALLDEAEDGDVFTVTPITMTRAEVTALPEFDGF